MDPTKLIDDAVRASLKEAGAIDVDLLLPTVKRDGIEFDEATRAVKGATEAVAAVKAAKPTLFALKAAGGGEKSYLDSKKPLSQIEREVDAARSRSGSSKWRY